jgi:hypothetical protein
VDANCRALAHIFVGAVHKPSEKEYQVLRYQGDVGLLQSIKVQHAGGGSREGIMFPADHVHPEFGYFCPSQSLRRKARLAFTFVTFCVSVGALALRASHETGSESLLTIAPVDKSLPHSETISTVGQSRAMSAAEMSHAQERNACQQDIHFDGECATDKVRRRVRPANDAPPIAAVALGRSVPSLADTTPRQPKSTEAPGYATIAPGITSGPTTAATEGSNLEATGQRVALFRKMRKVSANQNKNSYSDRGRGGIWNARAYAFPNSGYPRYQYTRSGWGSPW